MNFLGKQLPGNILKIEASDLGLAPEPSPWGPPRNHRGGRSIGVAIRARVGALDFLQGTRPSFLMRGHAGSVDHGYVSKQGSD